MSKAVTRKVTALAVHCFAARIVLADPAHGPSSPTSIFSPVSTPAQSSHGLSLFVLALTAAVFVLVFGLLAYAVSQFRERARWLTRLLHVAMLIGLQSNSLPGQSHVSEPAVNLGDTSFLDAPAGPGFVVEQIGDAAHDGRITDSAGNAVQDAGAVNSISGLTHIAWLGPKQFLGAWYGVEVVLSVAHVNAGARGEAVGLGSTTVSPFILQWREHRVLGIAIDQRVVADFDLPTGQYSRTSNVNIGANTFTVHPYYSITAFPAKRLETSWRVHYLWNSANNDPPMITGARSTQAGQAIHFNATAAYRIWKGLWIGPNAYYLKQITDGKIDAVALHNSPEQVGAIGPGMVWNSGSWFFYANAYQEFGAENRATGHKLVLRIEKTVKWPPDKKLTAYLETVRLGREIALSGTRAARHRYKRDSGDRARRFYSLNVTLSWGHSWPFVARTLVSAAPIIISATGGAELRLDRLKPAPPLSQAVW